MARRWSLIIVVVAITATTTAIAAAATTAAATTTAITAATTTTAAAAKAAAVTTAKATTAATKATGAGAVFLWLGKVDANGARVQRFAIQLIHRVLRALFGDHFHKAESLRAAAGAVNHHFSRLHITGGSKEILQLLVICGIRKIADIKSGSRHDLLTFLKRAVQTPRKTHMGH